MIKEVKRRQNMPDKEYAEKRNEIRSLKQEIKSLDKEIIDLRRQTKDKEKEAIQNEREIKSEAAQKGKDGD